MSLFAEEEFKNTKLIFSFAENLIRHIGKFFDLSHLENI
jgi:hypothetical protein